MRHLMMMDLCVFLHIGSYGIHATTSVPYTVCSSYYFLRLPSDEKLCTIKNT